jgi:hypothetical protein
MFIFPFFCLAWFSHGASVQHDKDSTTFPLAQLDATGRLLGFMQNLRQTTQVLQYAHRLSLLPVYDPLIASADRLWHSTDLSILLLLMPAGAALLHAANGALEAHQEMRRRLLSEDMAKWLEGQGPLHRLLPPLPRPLPSQGDFEMLLCGILHSERIMHAVLWPTLCFLMPKETDMDSNESTCLDLQDVENWRQLIKHVTFLCIVAVSAQHADALRVERSTKLFDVIRGKLAMGVVLPPSGIQTVAQVATAFVHYASAHVHHVLSTDSVPKGEYAHPMIAEFMHDCPQGDSIVLSARRQQASLRQDLARLLSISMISRPPSSSLDGVRWLVVEHFLFWLSLDLTSQQSQHASTDVKSDRVVLFGQLRSHLRVDDHDDYDDHGADDERESLLQMIVCNRPCQ